MAETPGRIGSGFTVGSDLYKRIVGSGVKGNLYAFKIPDLLSVTKKIIASKQYYNQKFVLGGSSPESVTKFQNFLSKIKKQLSIISSFDPTGSIFSLCKSVDTPEESHDSTMGFYWTRKSIGKINTPPLNATFLVDGNYAIYNILKTILDGIMLDKQHGIFNYPDNYIIPRIEIATFNPAVFWYPKTTGQITSVNIPIKVKNYHDCILNNIGGISKSMETKNTLEEFTASFEYEWTEDDDDVQYLQVLTAKSIYKGRTIGSVIT